MTVTDKADNAHEEGTSVCEGWILSNLLGTKKPVLLKAPQDCPGVSFVPADSRSVTLMELFVSGLPALTPLISDTASSWETPDPLLLTTRISVSSSSHVFTGY